MNCGLQTGYKTCYSALLSWFCHGGGILQNTCDMHGIFPWINWPGMLAQAVTLAVYVYENLQVLNCTTRWPLHNLQSGPLPFTPLVRGGQWGFRKSFHGTSTMTKSIAVIREVAVIEVSQHSNVKPKQHNVLFDTQLKTTLTADSGWVLNGVSCGIRCNGWMIALRGKMPVYVSRANNGVLSAKKLIETKRTDFV